MKRNGMSMEDAIELSDKDLRRMDATGGIVDGTDAKMKGEVVKTSQLKKGKSEQVAFDAGKAVKDWQTERLKQYGKETR